VVDLLEYRELSETIDTGSDPNQVPTVPSMVGEFFCRSTSDLKSSQLQTADAHQQRLLFQFSLDCSIYIKLEVEKIEKNFECIHFWVRYRDLKVRYPGTQMPHLVLPVSC